MAAASQGWQDPNASTRAETGADEWTSAMQADQQSGLEKPPESEHSEEVNASSEKLVAAPSLPSPSHWRPEPGFEHIDGDVDGRGYNETTVDIVAVPCIGASPVDTWARDPLGEDYFGAPSPAALLDGDQRYATVRQLPGSAPLTPTFTRAPLPKASHLWIRQGIRREVGGRARVLLYRHRAPAEGATLQQAADDLLAQLARARAGLPPSRPVFFVCHSIGGLVVKLALVRANRDEGGALRQLVFACHGLTFFSTPHRGSSYMSMPNLRLSIQHLLFLERPLPRSLARELRLGARPLLQLHERFADMASEFCIWTFYETVDSQLSGLGGSEFDEVHFSAPLTSIKSCLIGTRGELVLSVDSDHAHCASFGPHNTQTMHSYLGDLGAAVDKAESLSTRFTHTPLRLAANVKLELIGFYEDPDTAGVPDVRLYVSKHYLEEFLEKGPEDCLRERLSRVAPHARRGSRVPPSRRLASSTTGSRMGGALGIWNNVQELGQRFLGSPRSGGNDDAAQSPERDGADLRSPEIVVTSHAPRPNLPSSTSEPVPSVAVRRSRGLTVPALATPGFDRPSSQPSSERTNSGETARTLSEPVDGDMSPRSGGFDAQIDPKDTQGLMAATDERDHAPDSRTRKPHMSRASALQDLTAGFSRPNPSKRRFMWIHLPFNNPQWVKNIFDKLSETQNRNYSKLLSNDYWANRHVRGRHANQHASYVKPGCAFVPAETSSPRPSSRPSSGGRDGGVGGRSASPSVSPSHFYLYLPYLHYDTYVNLLRRRHVIRRRAAHGRARPVPRDVAALESLEARVIWEFIGHDPPLNTRRTLDQYGYPSLRDTYARDDDQMLYKLTKERPAAAMSRRSNKRRDIYHSSIGGGGGGGAGDGGGSPNVTTTTSPASRFASVADTLMRTENTSHLEVTDEGLEQEVLNGNLLMVDQLWLWAVDTTTLTTFFPRRESHPTEGPLFQQADLRNSIYNELNGDLSGRCDNALDLAAFITLHAVTVLLERNSHPDLEVFRIFEEALGVLTERMTSALKRFRMQGSDGRPSDLSSDYSSSSSSDGEFSSSNNSTEAIKRRHARELARAERQNRENTSAVLELRDMEDELNTLRGLFGEQAAAVEKMRESYEREPELRRAGTEQGRGFLAEALLRLEEYQKQTHDMLERVDTTRKDYEKLQEMIQRQAQVDEVRWSRLQTELASSQNLSVMIFTTFTVIFSPLGFFTSLFGMNTREWGGPGPNNFKSLAEIGAVALPLSALLVGATLVAAFSSRAQALFRALRAAWHALLAAVDGLVVAPLGRMMRMRGGPHHPRRRLEEERRRRARRLRDARAERRRERGYDFWETVRGEQRGGYEIPDTNRKRRPLGGGVDGDGMAGGGGGGVGRGTWRWKAGEGNG
ncbi:hypothetical protein GGR56DRAFT_681634 [Xylariaceae sp. FL0804]|nr:hypothetical protein GGR56DRAFT_681634 [Xylariaceae sp. FL0804]